MLITLFTSSLFLQIFLFYYLLYHCFFECFHFTNFIYCGNFLPGNSLTLLYRECYGCERAFFTLRRFLPHTPSRNLAPAFIKASLGPTVLPSRWFKGFPLRFETQTQPICLFESHSVQQKLLGGRFYLCIKALQATISISYRFQTHYLIAIRIAKPMPYPLSHRSS